jgi:hypothetical protein
LLLSAQFGLFGEFHFYLFRLVDGYRLPVTTITKILASFDFLALRV